MDEKQQINNTQTATPETMELKIGGTTYIVSGKYKENGKEGLIDKLWRLIEHDEDWHSTYIHISV